MAEIDSLGTTGTSFYYGGIAGAASQLSKNKKTEKSSTASKTSFQKELSNIKEEQAFEASGLPQEIQGMSMEDAAVFLKDKIDIAGNNLNLNVTTENIMIYKKTVQQFLTFVEKNNYEVEQFCRKLRKPVASKQNFFSPFELPPKTQLTRTRVITINQKLDALTREMLKMQRDNLKILSQVGEIKGLIIDLICA